MLGPVYFSREPPPKTGERALGDLVTSKIPTPMAVEFRRRLLFAVMLTPGFRKACDLQALVTSD